MDFLYTSDLFVINFLSSTWLHSHILHPLRTHFTLRFTFKLQMPCAILPLNQHNLRFYCLSRKAKRNFKALFALKFGKMGVREHH